MKKLTLTVLAITALGLAGCTTEPAEDLIPAQVTVPDAVETTTDTTVDPTTSATTQDGEDIEETNGSVEASVEVVDEDTTEEDTVEVAAVGGDDDLSSEAEAELEWVTYTNDEYGFSFQYPEEWNEPELKFYESSDYQEGTKFSIIFGDVAGTPSDLMMTFESGDFQFKGPADGVSIDFSDLDLGLNDVQLAENLKRPNSIDLRLERVENVNGFYGVRIEETGQSLDGNEFENTQYMLKTNLEDYVNVRIHTNRERDDIMDIIFESLQS